MHSALPGYSCIAQYRCITGLPDGYKPPEIALLESNSDKPESETEVLVVVTVPPRIVGQPPDPDGHTEWIVLGKTLQKFLGDPARCPFQPVPKPSSGSGQSYIIKSTPTMGKGMFARRNIKMGEIIFAERPLLIRPGAFSPPPLEMKQEAELRKYSHEDMEKVFLFEGERQLEVALGRMEPERTKNFLGLTNAHKEDEDGTGPLSGIARTNMYGCWELWDGDAGPSFREVYGMVCDVGSRINHRLDSGSFNDV